MCHSKNWHNGTPKTPYGVPYLTSQPPQTPPMKLNNDFDTIVDAYAQHVLDGMDSKTMERLIYDMLVSNLQSYNDEELVTEIVENYGDDWFSENEFQEPED
jgi:hypothetical protein